MASYEKCYFWIPHLSTEVIRWLVPLIRRLAKMPALQLAPAAPSSGSDVMLSRGPRPFTVSVEGNVGSGKSTFLRHFKGLEGVNVLEVNFCFEAFVFGYSSLLI